MILWNGGLLAKESTQEIMRNAVETRPGAIGGAFADSEFNHAMIIKADIAATNGVIHVDTVLLPPP